MFNKLAFILASSLLASLAWAGTPANTTKGSTTATVSAAVNDLGMCSLSKAMLSDDAVIGAHAHAFAQALAYMQIAYAGDVTLDVTRHGKHGAVHEVDLSATAGEGAVYAAVGYSSSWAAAVASDSTSAQVQATASRIANASKSLFMGIDFDIDLVVTQITVKAGTNASAAASAEASSGAYSQAIAYAAGVSNGSAASTAYAVGGGVTATNSSVLVQGANITNFQSQMGVSTGTFTNVQTSTLTQSYANAIATSMVYALAEASVKAEAESQLDFTWDLPILGSGSLPIVTDYDSATKAAQEIVNKSESIATLAQAMAKATAGILGNSSIQMNLQAQYENLPGLNDTLTASAAGNFNLDCSNAFATAEASASTTTN